MVRKAAGSVDEVNNESEGFHRGLTNRHIQLISLGGAIGVGLFLGSGRAIAHAGPGLILAYLIAGVAVFFIMRALGELTMHRAVSGSFATYAEQYVGPFAGFATGWSYWFVWITAGIAEMTAIGIYTHYWFPGIPQWVPALATLAVLYACNLLSVKLFGELEFWFAIVKIVTIVALLVAGPLVLAFGWGDIGRTASVSNLWSRGGFFPTGVLGVVTSLQIVIFAFAGVELLGVTAGEVSNPEKSLPRATNAIVWRIAIFYIGALLVIMMLMPWTEFSATESPFVKVFGLMGLPIAAGVINFVVITAAASSCNSGLFSTGRMLHTLAKQGQAPQALGRISRNHVPANGISVSVVTMLIGVALNYFIPEQVFVYITSVSLVGVLWTWAMIMLSHLRYRGAVVRGEAKASAFRMPFAPYANWAVIAFLALIAVFLAFDEGTRIALYVTPIWFGILAIGYRASRRSPTSHMPVSELKKL
ncbi:amino acid permease [Burkholderia lata]|uniref:Amino acid permease n=1 Tax=Burkholderia lata (strain ATCC 17760 / DSM 23089 / LMG 22485 / NCIMB 9086 / R18194 / 383) TaxID=482957 RepID=A0A6P2UMP1_BURL3|nr:amino acid permease [Burkholderia lata]VWC76221.1 amino acid permease [Burkholderia lata]